MTWKFLVLQTEQQLILHGSFYMCNDKIHQINTFASLSTIASKI